MHSLQQYLHVSDYPQPNKVVLMSMHIQSVEQKPQYCQIINKELPQRQDADQHTEQVHQQTKVQYQS